MVVVTASTVLIGMERIGRLDLLPAVFPDILAPPAVAAEYGSQPAWLTVRAPDNTDALRAAGTLLDPGEAEAIALALDLPKCTLLLDERRARTYADGLGLTMIGTFGIVVRAKRLGLISAARPLLDALVETGFRASAALYEETLSKAGEAED